MDIRFSNGNISYVIRNIEMLFSNHAHTIYHLNVITNLYTQLLMVNFGSQVNFLAKLFIIVRVFSNIELLGR